MDSIKNQAPKATKIKRESKNRIRVEFDERTSVWTRLRLRLTSSFFWINIVYYLFRFVLMLGISYVILFPFFSKIAGSFMSPSDFVDPSVRVIPKNFTLDIYKAIIIENNYFMAFLNTLLLSLACAVLQTFICAFVGYGLAKFKFKGNKLLFFLVILTMIVPHGTIKLSMMMHFHHFDLGGVQAWGIPGILNFFSGGAFAASKADSLINTFWPMIILSITGLAFKNGLYIFLMRQFFRGVPDELEESAYVDGSGVMRTYFQIVLPLAVPMMITIFLFSFSWQWTDSFYTTLFFTSKVPLMPSVINIPNSLKQGANYAAQTLYNNAINNTCGLLIILPLVVLYLFCQRYLVEGIERSGLVG